MKEGWKKLNLESLGFVGRGKSRHRPRNAEFLFGDKYPFVQTADVKAANYKITSYSQMYSEEGLKQSKLWPVDTLCITIAANIADAALLGIEACFPDSVIGFIPDDNKADVRFVKYLFDLLQVRIKQISQGAAQDNLSLEKLRTIKFDVPPLKTQRKIASILSAYDDLIENNLKRIKLLEEQAQLTYEEWFVRFKFPGHETTKFDEETGLPEGWEKGKIEDYFKTSSGGTPSRKKIKEYYTNGNINWVKTKELLGSFIFDTEEKITEKGLNNSSAKLFPANTILIGMYGGVHGEGRKSTLGQLGIITKPSTSNQACCAFLKKEGINYSVPYLFYYLKSKQKQLLNISMGAAQQNISQSMIKKFPFILPNKDVYDRFDEQVSLLFSSIIVLHKQNQHLKEARDMLLPRLMSGMIDPSTSSGQVVEKLDVGSLKYEVNDSLGMVAEAGSVYEKDKAEIESLFNTLNYDYEIAVVVLLTRQILNRNYGKKYIHKMFSNIKFLEALPVFKDLEFQENHWGMYCPVLEKTIGNQKYIRFDNIDDERSVINFNYKFIKEVTNWMNQDDYAKKFVSQVKNMLSIYQKSLIRMDMDRIELLNTVLECMNILETNNFDAIWHKMENWKMQEEGYKTKAEKFKPRETELMIDLIKDLK